MKGYQRRKKTWCNVRWQTGCELLKAGKWGLGFICGERLSFIHTQEVKIPSLPSDYPHLIVFFLLLRWRIEAVFGRVIGLKINSSSPVYTLPAAATRNPILFHFPRVFGNNLIFSKLVLGDSIMQRHSTPEAAACDLSAKESRDRRFKVRAAETSWDPPVTHAVFKR